MGGWVNNSEGDGLIIVRGRGVKIVGGWVNNSEGEGG